jgi:hypothetical protein
LNIISTQKQPDWWLRKLMGSVVEGGDNRARAWRITLVDPDDLLSSTTPNKLFIHAVYKPMFFFFL